MDDAKGSDEEFGNAYLKTEQKDITYKILYHRYAKSEKGTTKYNYRVIYTRS